MFIPKNDHTSALFPAALVVLGGKASSARTR